MLGFYSTINQYNLLRVAVELIATGIGTSNTVFIDDFNTQSANPNWVTTPNGYNTTCVPSLTVVHFGLQIVSPREFLTPP